MQNITGKIAFGGIAIGKIKEISKENNVVRRVKIEDAKAEIARFEAARDQAAEELKGLYDKTVKEVGEANAAIFEVHQMMLEDEDYLDSVRNIIEAQSVNAEFAVATTGDNFAKMFADMDDDYMKERAKVGSAVIQLRKHEHPPVSVKNEKFLFHIIRASFNQRRKTLANGLNNSGQFSLPKDKITEGIERLGKGAGVRGEALKLEEFAKLADYLWEQIQEGSGP